jgi:hypothetical protein
MRYLMLMWADADAASGDESDLQAWVDFDEQVKANGAFVLNSALAPASTDARLVQTAIAGHGLDGAVQRRPYAEGKRQIEAFYIMDLPNMDAALEWANRLPTYGHVEVRELLQILSFHAPARHQPPSPIQPHRAWTAPARCSTATRAKPPRSARPTVGVDHERGAGVSVSGLVEADRGDVFDDPGSSKVGWVTLTRC